MHIIKTSVIENIKHNFEELFPAEKKIAQYILDHLEEVTLLNISQLAKKAHASEASIVRMAKHLGYNDFFQMRLLLSNDLLCAAKLICEARMCHIIGGWKYNPDCF